MATMIRYHVMFVFIFVLAFALSVRGRPANFYQDFQVIWSGNHLRQLNGGRAIQLVLDQNSGCGFSSKSQFLFGRFSVKIKLIPGDSAKILQIPSYSGLPVNDVGSSSDTASLTSAVSQLSSVAGGGLHHHPQLFPLGLSLDSGRDDVTDTGAFGVKADRESVNMGSLYPAFEQLQPHGIRHVAPQVQQAFQGQPTPSTAVTVPHPPSIRPRVRARRGQATDPHSIAERLRRERISERIKALQELVPSCNKTDRAAMLDEILDYVKFLRLQVKVLSMSRLGGAGAVAQLVADIPLQSVEGDSGDRVSNQQVWEKWSNEETEREVAKLMEEDVGAAMQFLQSKSLCIMPISLAALIYPTLQADDPAVVKAEPAAP